MEPEPIDMNDEEALERRLAELKAARQASVRGPGAVAQGGGDALGARGAKVAGSNSGTINTGTLIVNHYHAASGTHLSKEEIAQRVGGYLSWLRDRTRSIELRGIERAGGAPVVTLPLETAYVPLRARARPRFDDAHEAIGGERQLIVQGERDADIALSQVLGLGNHLAIIGGPGSGKTTVLLHMACALASSLLAGQAEPACSRLGLTIDPSDLPLPIFVPLASYARYRRNLPGSAAAREKTLASFISYHLISSQADFDLPDDFFVRLLKDGREVLLLLDGLDEVANEGERAEVRQSVEELVSGRKEMRVIVTCRTNAYRSGGTALAADFREIAVQALDPVQHIAPMVTQAYTCIYPRDTALRNERIQNLLRGIQKLEADRQVRLGKDAAALVDSPLMVRMLLIVHMNNRELPDDRADLFDKAINALLQVDYGLNTSVNRELATDWKKFRDMSQHLALHIHRQGPDQGREIEESALESALREEAEFIPHIEAFLVHARERGSVLEERDGVYRFIHLAFQEFLVARYLREVTGGDGRDAILAVLKDRLDDPWWREPILLLAGYKASDASRWASEFISGLALAGTTPNLQFSAAELAGAAALAWRESSEAVRGSCARRIVALLNDYDALMGSKPIFRARAGDVLARLGDPRFDPQCFHLPADGLLGFVRIHADPEFRIGTRKADMQKVDDATGFVASDDEINDALTPTPVFYIARYPVTVGQFRAFVKATNFRLEEDAALRDPDSRPMNWVSWHEALKYCDWLNDRLADTPANGHSDIAKLVREGSWRIALPSELEWEKAARGGLRDAVFAWGDEPDANRANYDDTAIGATSSVGCFPANGYGLHDMLGNVWEWTRSHWKNYPYAPGDGREKLEAGEDVRRVMRGGSWGDPRDYARCASRLRDQPDLRDVSLGFRLVLRSAPVS